MRAWKTLPHYHCLQASLRPPAEGHLHSEETGKQKKAQILITKPKLARVLLIYSEYKTHQKDLALASCFQSLLSKNAIERMKNVKSLEFYSCLFLVPKPHQRWRPVIDIRLNTLLLVERFKMETPECIRASLILG